MKTHQEKLNELTTEIRNAIPRLMEFSDGCEIISKIEDCYNDIEIESNFIIGKNAKFYGEDIFIGGYFYSTDNFTIIGHEPLLNDVLQWLSIISRFDEYCINCTGDIIEIHEDENDRRRWFEIQNLKWDLSKSKLSEQSPELINFLHDLIK